MKSNFLYTQVECIIYYYIAFYKQGRRGKVGIKLMKETDLNLFGKQIIDVQDVKDYYIST